MDRLEETQIAWLEAKLGITKGSSKKKRPTFGDGLDGTFMHPILVYRVLFICLIDLMDDIDRIISVNTESSDHSEESVGLIVTLRDIS